MPPHAAGPRLPRPQVRYLTLMIALPLIFGACDPQRSLAPEGAEAASPSLDAAVTGGYATTPQRIVYATYRNAQYDIARMDVTGSNAIPLTSNTINESEPAWSFDNTRVALTRYRTTGGATRRDIYIINADGTNGHWARAQACGCDLGHAGWSPDGSRMVVAMSLNGVDYIAYLILGTGQLGAFSTGYGGLPGTQPSYTKTGQIVYVGPTHKTVFRMSGTGTNVKALYTAATPLAQPALSPDGSKLAFVQAVNEFGNTDIFLRNLTAGTTSKIAGSPANDVFPSWSPDGSRIAFSSGRSGVSQIYTITPTGGSVTRISHSDIPAVSPVWSH